MTVPVTTILDAQIGSQIIERDGKNRIIKTVTVETVDRCTQPGFTHVNGGLCYDNIAHLEMRL